MAKDNTPKPPSTMYLVLSGLVALFLIWQIFGTTEPPSTVIAALQWIFLILILGFLGYSVLTRKR